MYWCLGVLGIVWLTVLMTQQRAQIRAILKKILSRFKHGLAQTEATSESTPTTIQVNIPTEQILLHQINCCITAMLRAVYSEAVWDWDEKPTARYINEGECRRIKLGNAGEYNFAEIHIDKYSNIKLQLLKAAPCGEAKSSADAIVSDFDVDVEFWYSNYAKKILENIIGELNGRGIHSLEINAEGEIHAQEGKANILHGKIEKMIPQSSWEALVEFFKTKLELKADANDTGICVSW